MPTTKHRIAANLTDAEFGDLAAMADKYDVSLAWLSRKAILEFIARYRTEQLHAFADGISNPSRRNGGSCSNAVIFPLGANFPLADRAPRAAGNHRGKRR